MSETELTPEEKERKSFNKMVLFGSFLYGVIGLCMIIMPFLQDQTFMTLVYIGFGIIAFVITQSLWVLLKEDLSKFEKILLIIINFPIHLIFELSTW